MPLKHLCSAKYAEIQTLQRQEAEGTLPAPLPEAWAKLRPGFSAALRAKKDKTQGILPIIAEYKRASPSRGIINIRISPEDAAVQFHEAGATCISVLTEEEHFQGQLDYLHRVADTGGLEHAPLLRKDFIFHPLQVRATAATPASALLLMVRLTPNVEALRALRELTESFGMEAVVEVFDREELAVARASGARIIQVNARNLASLTVSREAGLKLARAERTSTPFAHEELWIAASGVNTAAHLREAAEAGFDAALVGTALMTEEHPGAALRTLLENQS